MGRICFAKASGEPRRKQTGLINQIMLGCVTLTNSNIMKHSLHMDVVKRLRRMFDASALFYLISCRICFRQVFIHFADLGLLDALKRLFLFLFLDVYE